MGTITTEDPEQTLPAPPPNRARRLLPPRVRILATQILAILVVLGVWEFVVKVGITTEFWLSSPTLVFKSLVDTFSTHQIWGDIWITLYATLLGFLIGSAVGIFLGLVLGVWRPLSDALDPIVVSVNAMPRIALAPLFVLYFGIGIWSKVALAISLVMFIMLMNARSGVRSADPDLVNAVRTMGGGKWFVVKKVLIPGTIPWLLAGARLSLAFSLLGIVVGEMLVSQRGLGHIIQLKSSVFDTTGVFAMIILTSVIAICLDQFVQIGEKAWNRRFGKG
jgi:NitT/TauT family transport system permease protein